MTNKFLVEEVLNEIHDDFGKEFGEFYDKNSLFHFSYETLNGESRDCFTIVNSMNVDIYYGNMMASNNDERNVVCVYSPYKSTLSKRSKKGYITFGEHTSGRPMLKPHNARTPNCPGCKLKIKDMYVILVLNMHKLKPNFNEEDKN